jgi:shikimate dehydrogenase
MNCVILGAVGTARAIASELSLAGVEQLTIVNRIPGPSPELANLVQKRTAIRAIYVAWEGTYRIPEATSWWSTQRRLG